MLAATTAIISSWMGTETGASAMHLERETARVTGIDTAPSVIRVSFGLRSVLQNGIILHVLPARDSAF